MSIKIKIENFQSIKNVEFEIDKYTVLTGPSNSGKSAICRAIEGALFNRTGDGFVRNGEKFSEVTITTDDHEIIWTKGSGKNHYQVSSLLFDKVGTEVPQPILDMGFKEVELSRSKLRPQMGTDQFDILFLIREQGSLISEVFSVLGRLDVITKAGKECSSDLKGKKSLLKTRYDDLASLDNKLVKYQGFEKVSLMSESLDAVQQYIKEEQDKLGLLVEAQSRIASIDNNLSSLSTLKKVRVPTSVEVQEVKNLAALKATRDSLLEVDEAIYNLSSISSLSIPEYPNEKAFLLIKKLSDINKTYKEASKNILILYKLTEVDIPLEVKESEIKKIEGLKKAFEKIKQLDKQIAEVSSAISSAEYSISEADNHLHDLMGSMEECPLCNRVMEKDYVS